MPQSIQLHQDKALENVSVAYRNTMLIADQLSPGVPVKHESDKFYVYAKDNFRLNQTLRANRAEANEMDWNVSTSTYLLDEHSIKHLVSDRDRENSDKPIRLDADTTEVLTDQILLRREVNMATAAFTAANWAATTSLTSTLAWSANTTLSNPITVVDSATSSVLSRSAKKANTAVVDFRTFQAAKEHVSVVDRIKHTSADSVTPGMLARLFNVDTFLVAGSSQNSGEEALTDSMAFIWTDACWVGYIERSPGLKKPSTFYTFFQKNGFGNPFSVKKWREEKRNGDMIEAGSLFQIKTVASDTAYLIVNTIQ